MDFPAMIASCPECGKGYFKQRSTIKKRIQPFEKLYPSECLR